MTLPNFLIIGAAKSGTTALYRYIGQHPQVFISQIKEPNFFALNGQILRYQGPGDSEAICHWSITDINSYRSLFRESTNDIAIGEASPLYLYSPLAPKNIKKFIPDVNIIVILRHPAERAYSAYLMMVRESREQLMNFRRALDEEDTRIRKNWEHIWHYKNMGYYYAQLSRYYEIFNHESIRVYLHEDLKYHPDVLFEDVFSFIDVDREFKPNVTSRPNMSGVPRSKRLHTLVNRRNPLKTMIKFALPSRIRQPLSVYLNLHNLFQPTFPPEIRSQLIEEYKEDITNLQKLINRDLSNWLI